MSRSRRPGRLTLDVTHLDAGVGVASDGTREFGVCGTLPGERVVADPVRRRKKRWFARPVELVSTHPDRVTPPCAAADLCGGCSLQHQAPAAQIAAKQATLADALGAIVPGRWLPPLLGPVTGYRTKARLGVKLVPAKGRVLVGFREQLSSYLAELDRCEVLASPAGGLLRPLSSLVEALSVTESIPQIEVAVGEDATMLVLRHLAPLEVSDLMLLRQFERDEGVRLLLQPGGPDTVAALDGQRDVRIHYDLPEFDLRFALHPLDFSQVNTTINRQMVSRAIELLDLQAEDRALDLFCGIGNFTLPMARRAGFVRGLDLDVERARENVRGNAMTNVSFDSADLYSGCISAADLAGIDKLLLDPPRAGAEAVVDVLAAHPVGRVVYVSCNPVTFARDVTRLAAAGYRLEAAGVMDMFPHTAHVESMGLLIHHGEGAEDGDLRSGSN